MLHLDGAWVHMEDFAVPDFPEPTSGSGSFVFSATNRKFLDVMAYYHIDALQNYIQTDLDLAGVGDFSIEVDPQGESGSDLPKARAPVSPSGRGHPRRRGRHGHRPRIRPRAPGHHKPQLQPRRLQQWGDRRVLRLPGRGLFRRQAPARHPPRAGSCSRGTGIRSISRRAAAATILPRLRIPATGAWVRAIDWPSCGPRRPSSCTASSEATRPTAVKRAARDLSDSAPPHGSCEHPRLWRQLSRRLRSNSRPRTRAWLLALRQRASPQGHLRHLPPTEGARCTPKPVDVYVDDGAAAATARTTATTTTSRTPCGGTISPTQRTSGSGGHPTRGAVPSPADHRAARGQPANVYVQVKNRGAVDRDRSPCASSAPGRRRPRLWPSGWTEILRRRHSRSTSPSGGAVTVGPFTWTPAKAEKISLLTVVECAEDRAVTQDLGAEPRRFVRRPRPLRQQHSDA